jgi:hypothetical protein
LRELGLTASDAAGIDLDPEAPTPARIGIVSPHATGWSTETDLLVIGGEGDPPKHARAQANVIRLKETDFISRSRAWQGFVERLRKETGRASIGLDAEALREELDRERNRADAAEAKAKQVELDQNNLLFQRDNAKRDRDDTRKKLDDLQQTCGEHEKHIGKLESLIDEFGYHLPDNLTNEDHNAATRARALLWQGRIAAALAGKAADLQPDVLSWSKGAVMYSGDIADGLPEGYGVLIIRKKKDIVSTYRGQFSKGRRHGHGACVEGDGHTWTGEWRNDEAIGFGCLTTPNGSRFEGETIAGVDGAPVKAAGCIWREPLKIILKEPRQVHVPRQQQLPPPDRRAIEK